MEISIFFSSLQEILCVSRSLGFDFGFPVGWPQNSRGFMIGRKSRNNFGGSWGYSLGGGGVNGNLFFSWEVKRRYTALWIVVSPLKKKKLWQRWWVLRHLHMPSSQGTLQERMRIGGVGGEKWPIPHDSWEVLRGTIFYYGLRNEYIVYKTKAVFHGGVIEITQDLIWFGYCW